MSLAEKSHSDSQKKALFFHFPTTRSVIRERIRGDASKTFSHRESSAMAHFAGWQVPHFITLHEEKSGTHAPYDLALCDSSSLLMTIGSLCRRVPSNWKQRGVACAKGQFGPAARRFFQSCSSPPVKDILTYKRQT
jgi:hypothetical protein